MIRWIFSWFINREIDEGRPTPNWLQSLASDKSKVDILGIHERLLRDASRANPKLAPSPTNIKRSYSQTRFAIGIVAATVVIILAMNRFNPSWFDRPQHVSNESVQPISNHELTELWNDTISLYAKIQPANRHGSPNTKEPSLFDKISSRIASDRETVRRVLKSIHKSSKGSPLKSPLNSAS